MDNPGKEKWYFKTWALVVSFLTVGPFMLPLVWGNPKFSKRTKIIVSAAIGILTYLLTVVLFTSLKSLGSYYQLLQI